MLPPISVLKIIGITKLQNVRLITERLSKRHGVLTLQFAAVRIYNVILNLEIIYLKKFKIIKNAL